LTRENIWSKDAGMKLARLSSVGSLVITTIVAIAVVAGSVLAVYYVQSANGIHAFDAATNTPSNSSNAPQTVRVAAPASSVTNLNVITQPAGEGQGSTSAVQGGSFEIAPQPPITSPPPTPQPPINCAMAVTGSTSCPPYCEPCYHPIEGVSPMIMCPMTTEGAQSQLACSSCGYPTSTAIACKAY
jgi:hypothetical protein